MARLCEEDFLKDLFDRGILYLSGEITAKMAEQFGRAVVWLNAAKKFEEITLFIDSGGGSNIAALQIYDMIKYSKIPIRGVVYRRAYSSAAIILQACHVRSAFSSAEVLFHDLIVNEGVICVTDSHSEIDKKLAAARARQHAAHLIIAKRSGRSLKEAAKFSKLEMNMSATEALERGFLDEIIEHIP